MNAFDIARALTEGKALRATVNGKLWRAYANRGKMKNDLTTFHLESNHKADAESYANPFDLALYMHKLSGRWQVEGKEPEPAKKTTIVLARLMLPHWQSENVTVGKFRSPAGRALAVEGDLHGGQHTLYTSDSLDLRRLVLHITDEIVAGLEAGHAVILDAGAYAKVAQERADLGIS